MAAKMKRKSGARKTSTVPTRVHAHGALRLSDEQDKLVWNQVWLAHLYRNVLVEIERKRRDTYRAIRVALSPQLAELETQYDHAQEEYQEARKLLSQVAKASRAQSPVAAHVKALAKARNAVWELVRRERAAVERKHFGKANAEFKRRKAAKVAKKKLETGAAGPYTVAAITSEVRAHMQGSARWSDAWKQKDLCEEAAQVARRAARAASGCFTGVYLAVESAAERSFKDTKFNPRFVTFDHTGTVGSQITGMVTVADALAGRSPLIKIEMRPDVHLRGEKRAARVGQPVLAAVARLRLGSANRECAHLDIPFVMHRPLPSDGVLKWIYLHIKRIGLRTVYEIQFTLESEQFVESRAAHDGTIAINVGWRVLDNGDVRVATTWDGLKEGEVRLPVKMRRTVEHAEDVHGYADDHFNVARDVLKSHLLDAKLTPELTESLKIASLSQWRSHGKLAKVARAMQTLHLDGTDVGGLWAIWRNERVPAKPARLTWTQWGRQRPKSVDLFDTFDTLSAWFKAHGVRGPAKRLALYLEWWRRKDAHLINVARGDERHAMLHRREIYRVTARRWADQYKTAIVERWNKSETAETPEPEHDTRVQQEEKANAVRQFCGVSVLGGAVMQAFGRANVIEQNAAGISRIHSGCGGTADSTRPHQMVRCGKCGRMYDQDVNAARHLWDRERSGDNGSPVTARKRSGDVAAE